MTFRCIALTLLFLIPAPWLPSTAAQEDPQAQPEQNGFRGDPWGGAPHFPADAVELTIFTPKNLTVDDLFHTVWGIHGRAFFIEENGPRQTRPDNMQILGDSILIFDTPEYTAQVLTALVQLDSEASSPERTRQRILRESELVLFEYRPRYLTLNAIADALEPFQRTNTVYRDVDDRRFDVTALTPAWSQGMLIVRDTAEAVEEIKAFLGRIDIPAPHVTVSCLVLQATREKGSENLPAELVEHLSQLVPYEKFNLLTMGLVQSAISPEMQMVINMPMEGGECTLMMQADAFDEIESSLTLREVRFETQQHDGPKAPQGAFSTRATLHADEYVVLGASGPQPIFVVMRMAASGARPSGMR